MKFLAILFLACFAVALAVPLTSHSHELEAESDIEEIISGQTLEADKEISLEEVKKQLKERFDVLLKKIKDAIKGGEFLKEDTLRKLRELREKFQHLGLVHFSNSETDAVEEVKEWLRNLFDKLGIDDVDIEEYAENILAAEGDFDVDKLKEKFNELVNKVKDAFEQGKSFKDALEKLQDLKEKLKLLNIDIGEKGREYLEILKEKVKDYWKKLKEKLGSKRSADIDVFGILEELKQVIREKFDADKIKEFVNKIFKKGSELREQLLNLLREKGETRKQKIIDWIDRILGEKESQRSISDVYQKIRDYFRELNIELKEKFVKFGEWVKTQYEKGLEKGKSKAENVRQIAKEFLKDVKKISKDVADEALDFFKDYKQDLGKVYDDLVEKVREVFKKDQDESQRSISDVYNKLKEYFKELNIELKEKFVKFGEWVKTQYEKGLEKGKSKAENVRKIANEFLKDVKKISKDVADEALDFFKDYKQDLGKVYDDLVEKVREVFKKDQDESQRSISDVYNKLKEYFKELNIELKEKFVKFGEWVKTQYEKGLEKGKSKAENVRQIAKEFLKDVKTISKDVADEALDFFKDYKQDLGKVYDDLVDKVREVFKKDQVESQRSISDVYNKLKEYFKELNIELKAKFVKFGEWVKTQYEKGLEKGKSKVENVKKIAEQFLKDTQKIGKDMAQEALDFFEEYKQDLGTLYDDLVKKVRNIVKS